mgnify:CR=1 FL=1
MKYVVAPGACFGYKGKNLEAGAEITADMFDPKTAFDKFIEKGKIIPVEGGGQTIAAKTSDKTEVKNKSNFLQKLTSPLRNWRKK